jgi:hypothetical protein
MLPVSTVYIAWKHGDMVDAYLRLHGSQVIKITPAYRDDYRLSVLCSDGTIRSTVVSRYTLLEIRDVEGELA